MKKKIVTSKEPLRIGKQEKRREKIVNNPHFPKDKHDLIFTIKMNIVIHEQQKNIKLKNKYITMLHKVELIEDKPEPLKVYLDELVELCLIEPPITKEFLHFAFNQTCRDMGLKEHNFNQEG